MGGRDIDKVWCRCVAEVLAKFSPHDESGHLSTGDKSIHVIHAIDNRHADIFKPLDILEERMRRRDIAIVWGRCVRKIFPV